MRASDEKRSKEQLDELEETMIETNCIKQARTKHNTVEWYTNQHLGSQEVYIIDESKSGMLTVRTNTIHYIDKKYIEGGEII